VTVHHYGRKSRRKGRALGSVEGKVRKVDSVRMEERRVVKDMSWILYFV
jgi:hypothetical protein